MKKLLLSAIVILGMASCEKEQQEDLINLGGDISVSFKDNTILVRNGEKINTFGKEVYSITCSTNNCDYWYKSLNFKESLLFKVIK